MKYIPEKLFLPLPDTEYVSKDREYIRYFELFNYDTVISKIVENLNFQRLRKINQLNCYLLHGEKKGKITRFLHSLNCGYLACNFVISVLLNEKNKEATSYYSKKFDEIYGFNPNLSDEKRLETNLLAIVLGSLLHDLGHIFGSHDAETMFGDRIKRHEERSCFLTKDLLYKLFIFKDHPDFIVEDERIDESFANKVCAIINPPTDKPVNLFTSVVNDTKTGYDLDKVEYITREWIYFSSEPSYKHMESKLRQIVPRSLEFSSTSSNAPERLPDEFAVINSYFSAVVNMNNVVSEKDKTTCNKTDDSNSSSCKDSINPLVFDRAEKQGVFCTFLKRKLLFENVYRSKFTSDLLFSYYTTIHEKLDSSAVPSIMSLDNSNFPIDQKILDDFIHWNDETTLKLYREGVIKEDSVNAASNISEDKLNRIIKSTTPSGKANPGNLLKILFYEKVKSPSDYVIEPWGNYKILIQEVLNEEENKPISNSCRL